MGSCRSTHGRSSGPRPPHHRASPREDIAEKRDISVQLSDFRQDLTRIDVPTLVVHADAGRILPLATTGKRTPELVKGSKLAVEGGPPGLNWTHAEEVNRALLGFLRQTS
jgi:pimeloyl-ACP methyl ester carboxylesterase